MDAILVFAVLAFMWWTLEEQDDDDPDGLA